MNRRGTLAILCTLLLSTAGYAAAQERSNPSPVRPEAHGAGSPAAAVPPRLNTPGLLGRSSVASASRTTIPELGLDLGRSARRSARRGALWGAAIGAVPTFLFLTAFQDSPGCGPLGLEGTPCLFAITAGTGVLGAGIGAWIGAGR